MNENGMNANSIKAFMHNKALTLLTPQLQPYPEYLIMDEFVNGPKYFDYLKKLPSKPSIVEKNLYFIQKGESVHVAVAAASIIARAAFVDYMDQLSKDFNQIIPKGASSHVDEAGRRLVKLHGENELKRISKWHFANTTKILKK